MTRAENIALNQAERDAQAPTLKSRPQRIVLEMTNKCNLRCTMCAISYNTFSNTSMDMALFEKVWPFIETAREVALFGYGEPLVNPHFKEMFERCAQVDGLVTYFTTNGTMLDRVAESIVVNRLTYLGISTDGATPETYERIRRGGKLQKLIDNVKLINHYKQLHGLPGPYMRFAFVGMRDNIHELPMLVRLAAELGMQEVKFTYLVAHTENMREQVLWYHPELVREHLGAARDEASRLGIKLNTQPTIGEDTSTDFHRPCHVAWEDLFVGSDGKVRPCMISNDVLGDLGKEDLETIWNGPLFQEFRQRVNSACPPKDCQNCWQVRHMNVNREEAHVRIGIDVGTAKVKAPTA
ncbi:MAG TPA: radical SAM protein [Oscillatoriaceae cyanobacterium]